MSQKFHLLHDSLRTAGIGQCNSDYGNFSFCFLARRRRIQIGKLFNEFSDSSAALNVVDVVIVVSGKWMEGKCKEAHSPATAIAHKPSGRIFCLQQIFATTFLIETFEHIWVVSGRSVIVMPSLGDFGFAVAAWS